MMVSFSHFCFYLILSYIIFLLSPTVLPNYYPLSLYNINSLLSSIPPNSFHQASYFHFSLSLTFLCFHSVFSGGVIFHFFLLKLSAFKECVRGSVFIGEMYAETGLLFPYFQNFSLELQQLEEYCKIHKSNASVSNLVDSSAISEYDLALEGDLFKAPEPIIEEPVMDLDLVAAAVSMISCGEDVVSSQGLKSTDIDALESEQLLSEVFYECKKDLLEKAAMDSPFSEILDTKVPVLSSDEYQIQENKQILESPLLKSVSLGSLSSMGWMHGAAIKPAFLEFPGIDFDEVYGMRRAFSEGDIKALGKDNVSLSQSSHERPFIVSNCTSEERREKLSRYRNKKTKRNFGRKIKYACRKALADSQPRIRGRFAKTEELDVKRL